MFCGGGGSVTGSGGSVTGRGGNAVDRIMHTVSKKSLLSV